MDWLAHTCGESSEVVHDFSFVLIPDVKLSKLGVILGKYLEIANFLCGIHFKLFVSQTNYKS